MGKAATLFVAGVIGIGMASALFLPGRQTVAGIKQVGDSGSKLLGTAISGK